MRLETKLATLIPDGNGPFEITAFELTHDGEGWSVNTPFNIGKGLDRAETLSRLRSRWEIFKANYSAKARVGDFAVIGDDERCACLENACMAFADVRVTAESGVAK